MTWLAFDDLSKIYFTKRARFFLVLIFNKLDGATSLQSFVDYIVL